MIYIEWIIKMFVMLSLINITFELLISFIDWKNVKDTLEG